MSKFWIIPVCLVFASASASAAVAAGVRSHTRAQAVTSNSISDDQASTLTLSLTAVETRPIQSWVRASAQLDSTGKGATAIVRGPDANLVKPGQRVRLFAVSARSQMHQGRVERASLGADGATVAISLAAEVAQGSRYLVEIVADRGDYLSVPNVAVIEEGDRHVVYVDAGGGRYEPKAVQTGVQGELYTQILGGVDAGTRVVSIGSFFIDAENKLKLGGGDGAGAMAGMDHSSMPGMDHSR